MSFRNLWLLPLAALLLGCPPKIGNKCTVSTDCSQLGDRLCDTNQPNGYCTVFNCEPDNCPDAICVGFDPNLDPACKTADDGRWPRFQRTFCMKACSSDGDCRDEYECVDLSIPGNQTSRRAEVVDTGAADGGLGFGVCMVRLVTSDGGTPMMSESDGGIPGVCRPADAGLVDGAAPWTPYTGSTGSTGSGGTGGMGGAGGSSP
ncbi:Hypothetical protein A7982_08661 [Minicystis rosea]|nr:Hypothetical protein A7982_08661 [Minicystis rosea]